MPQSQRGWVSVFVGNAIGVLAALSWAAAIGFQIWSPPDIWFWPIQALWLLATAYAIRQLRWVGLLAALPLLAIIPMVALAGLIFWACTSGGSCP